MNSKVVLVDENNQEIGITDKFLVHTDKTPLHRGLSVFLFNGKNELLLQQRAKSKLTFPGIWSNSCCGHPRPGEEGIEAVRRHLDSELGIKEAAIHLVLPDFRYTAEMNGIRENELCPVFVAFSNDEIRVNPQEVENIRWVDWDDFIREIKDKPGTYSKWAEEEALLLEKSLEFNQYRSLKTTNIA